MDILTSPFCSVVVQSEVILTNVPPSVGRRETKAKSSHQSWLSFAAHTGHFCQLASRIFFCLTNSFLQSSTMTHNIFFNHLVISSISSYASRLIASTCLLNLYTSAFTFRMSSSDVQCFLCSFYCLSFPWYHLFTEFLLCGFRPRQKQFDLYLHIQRVIQYTSSWISWWSDRKSQLSIFLYWLTNISST